MDSLYTWIICQYEYENSDIDIQCLNGHCIWKGWSGS